MNEGDLFVMVDVPIELTMPDGSIDNFLLKKPNGTSGMFWFEMTEESPSGRRIFKDPIRRKQKAFVDYYPVFHLNYSHHYMFTTKLLVATNIALRTPPGFLSPDNYITTNCLLQNERAVKDYFSNWAVAAYSTESEEKANPIPSGSLDLTFIGKDPLTWQEALDYYFYQRMDSSGLLASSDEPTSNDDIVIHS